MTRWAVSMSAQYVLFFGNIINFLFYHFRYLLSYPAHQNSIVFVLRRRYKWENFYVYGCRKVAKLLHYKDYITSCLMNCRRRGFWNLESWSVPLTILLGQQQLQQFLQQFHQVRMNYFFFVFIWTYNWGKNMNHIIINYRRNKNLGNQKQLNVSWNSFMFILSKDIKIWYINMYFDYSRLQQLSLVNCLLTF